LGSGDITHLHIFSASLHRSAVPQNGSTEILRRRFPGGCSRSPGDRRRARRDVRLRASSLRWTPGAGTSSPWIPARTVLAAGKGRFLAPEASVSVLL
jgi:hypothetical protein